MVWLNGHLKSARFFDSTTPRATCCAVSAPYDWCSQRQRSARPASMNSLGKASITDYSRAFGLYGDNSPTNGTCPLLYCSAMRRSVIWRGFAQDHQARSALFAASENASSPISDNVSSNSSLLTAVPMACRSMLPPAVTRSATGSAIRTMRKRPPLNCSPRAPTWNRSHGELAAPLARLGATSQSSSRIIAQTDWSLGSTQRRIERLSTL